MWSPPDRNALPSPEEIKQAKEVITTLEGAIRDAVELVESTNLRIAEMTRDLEERKSWIAPIRKVPTEVLVDILLRASEMDDLAPIRFTAVSRLWRDIILATPKAWSFIHLRRHYNIHVYLRDEQDYHDYFAGYKNTYFERSEPRPLHLSLPDTKGFYPKHANSIIRQQAHRIQCLTTRADVLRNTRSAPQCQQFPYLRTLTLVNGGEGENFDTSFFTISRFPALQTLRWPRCVPLTTASPAITPSTFPPLLHLSIGIGTLPSCMDILRSCAATLQTLRISLKGQTTTPLQIRFPLLRYLRIESESSSEGCPTLVKATTPVLTSLDVASPDPSIPTFFDADMQTVTHMRWNTFKTPSFCTHARILQIMVNPKHTGSRTGGYADCANKLKEIADAYPLLERIELGNHMKGYIGFRVMQQKVEENLGDEVIKSKLLWTREWQCELSGYVVERCGWNMPCNYW